MTGPFRRWPDIQRVLVEGLEEMAGGPGHTGAETPAVLSAWLPFVRVMRTGGPSGFLDDRPIVDIDVFGPSYAVTEELAERIRQHIVGPPPPWSELDKASCEIGPRELPWGDGSIRRFHATYEFVSRRRMSA